MKKYVFIIFLFFPFSNLYAQTLLYQLTSGAEIVLDRVDTTFDCSELNGTFNQIDLYTNDYYNTGSTLDLYWDGVLLDSQSLTGSAGSATTTFTFSDVTCTSGTVIMKVETDDSENFRVKRASDDVVQTYFAKYTNSSNTFNADGEGAVLVMYSDSEEETESESTVIPLPIISQLSTTTCEITATSATCSYFYSTTTSTTTAYAISQLIESQKTTPLTAVNMLSLLAIFALTMIFVGTLTNRFL
jgi:hypothetical protein